MPAASAAARDGRRQRPGGHGGGADRKLRGHDVSIWEREDQLGGKLEVAGLAPSKREVLRFRDFQARRLDELGVEIHLGAEVTPEAVAASAPDASWSRPAPSR